MKLRRWTRWPISKQRLSDESGHVSRLACVLVLLSAALFAAQPGGFVTGVVRDRSGAVIPGAEVRIESELTGARQKVYCDSQGKYISAELAAGTYKITVRNQGFRTVTQPGIVVQPGQTRVTDFFIDVLPLQQEVTVEGDRDDNDPTASGLAVSRHSSASALPMNGRDLHALYAIMPGATIAPASSSDGGQFTVSGQRPNTNTFRIDGISGNTGIGISAVPGAFPGSSLPETTVIGSTQGLASKEEIQRIDLRSSDFAPEYGDRPGAQIAIETRAGSNEFHGSAFGYIRPQFLDTRDWFAQKYYVPLPAASLNGYGASLGGALFPDRTFFFVAFEQMNVADTALQLMPVPSLPARAAAANPYQLILNAFPLPSGPQLNADESLGTLALEKQAAVSNYSGRIDQTLGEKVRLFGRYANIPSHSTTSQLGIDSVGFRSDSATLGATMQWAGAIHDFRVNFSRVVDTSSWAAANQREQAALDAFAQPFADFYFPFTITELSVAGLGQLVSGTNEVSSQNQWEGTYTLAKQFGRHDFRAGADYIRLLPRLSTGEFVPTTSIVSPGIEALLAGETLGVTASDGRLQDLNSRRIQIASLFVQDTFKWSDRLTILYGLRWEITPPDNLPFITDSSAGIWNGPGTQFYPLATISGINVDKWPWRYTQLAPRFGSAYHLKAPDLVLRVGAGIFYDDALGSLINPVNLSPLNAWQFLPVSGDLNLPPQPILFPSTVPSLYLPKVWEWRTSLEKSIHGGSAISLAYVGAAGRQLLREEAGVDPQTGILEWLTFASSGTSDYDALQAQFRGQLTPNLYALISYTWGHSIDTGSQDSSVFLAQPGYSSALDRGSSSFDIRHNLSASFSYRLPSWNWNSLTRKWINNWNLSSNVQARTGFPFDVSTVDRSIGLGFANSGRPDLVPGVPVWIDNSSVPGGRELNPAAFLPAPAGTNGTLGRDVLTGSGLFQIDASLRRQFRIYRGSSLEMNLTAFNVLNRANFSNPVGYLGSALFGQPTSMQNLMLGSGSPSNGITPIFQSGGPRTVELNLKFSF